MRWRFIKLLLVIGLALVVLLAGCTPPYPTHKRMAGTGGVITNLPELSTVQPGKSRRDDVLSAFKAVDTGISMPWFFWGRWKSSSAALRGITDSGIEEIPIWKATNLLVEFDDSGIVKNAATVSDKRVIPELQRILSAHLESAAQLAATLIVQARFYSSDQHSCRGAIALSPAAFEFSNLVSHDCPSGFRLPLQKITVVPFAASPGEFDPGPVGWIRVKLQFADPTPFGHEIKASLKVGDLFSLLRFLHASRSKGNSGYFR